MNDVVSTNTNCSLTLQVKVDGKTQALLDSYEQAHKQDEESVKREDRLVQAALDAVMREFANELKRNAPPQRKHDPHDRPFGPVSGGPKADEVCNSFPFANMLSLRHCCLGHFDLCLVPFVCT